MKFSHLVLSTFLLEGLCYSTNSVKFPPPIGDAEIGSSEKALQEMRKFKKLDLDIIISLANKNRSESSESNPNKVQANSKNQCVDSKSTNLNEDNDIQNHSTIEKGSCTKGNLSAIQKGMNYVTSFLPVSFIKKNQKEMASLNEEKMNKIEWTKKHTDQEHQQPYVKSKETTNISEQNEQNTEEKEEEHIGDHAKSIKNMIASFVQFRKIKTIAQNIFRDDASGPPEIRKAPGNRGSFFMVENDNTDYPWACSCNERQLEEFRRGERDYVLCDNQIDSSLENNELICDHENGSFNIFISYLILIISSLLLAFI